MTISAVMVNYKTQALVKELTLQLSGMPMIERIIAVDNSRELSENLTHEFTKLRLIHNDANIGFGAAVNQAIALVDTDWLLVINPDVRLLPDCLEQLLETAKKYRSPIVGPRFYMDDHCRLRLPPATGGSLWIHVGQIYAEISLLDAKLRSFYWQIRHDRFWKSETPFYEPFLSGACLLVHCDWIKSMGDKLFDERFFLYFEDTDLCARAVLEGLNPLCVPSAKALHYYNQSPSPDHEKMRFMQESGNLYLKKYYDDELLYCRKSFSHHPGVSCHFTEMGVVDVPPLFNFDQRLEKDGHTMFFEIATNPGFVPFVQSVIVGNHFVFPEDAWKRLASGTYYARLRCDYADPVTLWRFVKK